MRFLQKGYMFFFFLGIFFIPFNSDIPEWFGFLGEYSRDSSPIFFLVAFLLLMINSLFKGKIYLPLKSTPYTFFLFFIIILCICTLINIFNIADYYFKQTSGFQRFIRQLLSVIIVGVLFFIVFLNVCKEYGAKAFFLKIRKLFLYSFVLVFVCGIIEYIIVAFNFHGLLPIFELFNYLPFVNVTLSDLNRVSSLTYEPPALGTYLITIAPFMFSYIISEKKSYGFIPFLLVIVLALLSKSRTVLVVAFLQSLIAIYLSYKVFPRFRIIFIKFVTIGSMIGFVVLLIFWNPVKDAVTERIQSLDITKTEYSSKDNSVSNKSRLGIQYAMFQVYKQNPIFGTGWGQQAFESKNHYPKWAIERNWEFSTKYLNENIKSFPPGYNMYLRILTETGIIGFLVFLLFLFFIIQKSYQAYNSNKNLRFISITLLISFYGMFLNWLQIDSFGVYGFWLSFAILIIFNKNTNERNNSLNSAL